MAAEAGELRPRGQDQRQAGDAQYFDQLVYDTHKKAADSGYRPAKEGDDRFDAELQQVIFTIGTWWLVSCKRQIVDGDGHIGYVIEWWIYRPDNTVYGIIGFDAFMLGL